jgi:integrase
MLRIKSRVPKLSHHKASGQAVVRLSGKDHYVGRFGTPEAEAEYGRLLAAWFLSGRQLVTGNDEISVNELMLAYWKHCEKYYRRPDGTPTSELRLVKRALRPVKELYGHTSADSFGPAALKAVRQRLIDQGLCRKTTNKQVGRIRQMFRWAVENELVPPSTHHGLTAVKGLQRGRTEAKDYDPVRPVPEAWIEAVRPLVASPVRAMIELQLLTGMRPGEVAAMRACDLDCSGAPWFYRPKEHKTAHHGHDRVVYIGPKAQAIVRRFLKSDPEAYLFSPADSRSEQYAEKRANRKTKVQPSQVSRKKKRPQREPGDHYDVAGYRRAVKYACERAFPLPEHLQPQDEETIEARRKRMTPEEVAEAKAWRKEHTWHPHQLRHNAATYLRKEFGIEVARIILGHRNLRVTEVYAEADRERAIGVVAKVG